MSFSERLAELITERGLSKLALSKKIGISDRVIGAWVKGENGINLENALTVASFFEVSLDYLAGRSDVREMATKKAPASIELTENERELLKYFSRLPEREQLLLIGEARYASILDAEKKEPSDATQAG